MKMTLEAYLSHQRKHASVPAIVERESDLHREIIDYCRQRGWICLHGSMAHRTYRTMGECDFTILMPGGRVLFVECKSKNGKLSVEQQGMKLWMQRLGHPMNVVRSFAEFQLAVDGTNSTSKTT